MANNVDARIKHGEIVTGFSDVNLPGFTRIIYLYLN